MQDFNDSLNQLTEEESPRKATEELGGSKA